MVIRFKSATRKFLGRQYSITRKTHKAGNDAQHSRYRRCHLNSSLKSQKEVTLIVFPTFGVLGTTFLALQQEKLLPRGVSGRLLY